MEIKPQIFSAKVMHKRLFPKVNSFTYGVYYLALPLPAEPIPGILQSFPKSDLGYRDGRCPEMWAREILKSQSIEQQISHIIILTMPKVMGYVFNPVSFYLCMDSDKLLRAVICEVHNTFGEQHSYLCVHTNHAPITSEEWLEAEKLFHVSPFLERSGKYRFRFDVQAEKIGIWIDYFNAENNKQLITSLIGTLSPLNKQSLTKAFWTHPMVTLKAISLIHWQAIKLFTKGIKYIRKPIALEEKLAVSADLTKM